MMTLDSMKLQAKIVVDTRQDISDAQKETIKQAIDQCTTAEELTQLVITVGLVL